MTSSSQLGHGGRTEVPWCPTVYLVGGGGRPEWMKYRDASQRRKRADGEPADENIGVAQAYLLCDTLYVNDFDSFFSSVGRG